jgi:hypothetical protein
MILPIVLVTIQGAAPNIDRDVDNANTVWGNECGVFFDVIARLVVNRPNLLVLDQNDCLLAGHVVSAEEDELFDLGRGLGTDVVGYYINGDVAGFAGCAAHPPGRRGFWVGGAASPWTFGHEATHVVGQNVHVGDSDNLMFTPTAGITNPPPDLTDDQQRRILADPALLSVESIVLSL